MKKTLAKLTAAVVLSFLTVSAHAGVVWNNTSGDNMWNTVGNWGANPVNGTDIFTSGSPNTVVPGYPDGTVFLNADFQCQRVRQNTGAVARYVTIAETNTADAKLTLTGAAETFDCNAATQPITFDGATNAQGAKLTMQFNSATAPCAVNANTFLILNVKIAGNGGVNKTSAGTIILGGDNTYSAATTVQAGLLQMGHPHALGWGGTTIGTNNPGTTVLTGGTLDLGGQVDINELLTLNGDGITGTNGAIINNSNVVASLAGGVISTISITAGGNDYEFPTTVSITGGGGSGATATASLGLTTGAFFITNAGSGYTNSPTVSFSGGGGSGASAVSTIDTNTGTVTGITIVNPGRDYTNAPTVTLSGGGGVDATAEADTVHFTVVGTTVTSSGSGYTSAPSVDFSGGENGAGATATANIPYVILETTSSVAGSGDITINSAVTGAGGLTKNGEGTLTLTAGNTYGDATIVTAGKLLANNASGSATGAGAVTVNGGLLGGSGSIAGAVAVNTGGSIGAGNSAGTLTLAGGLDMSGGGTNVWELAANSTSNPGTDFDQLAVTGGTLTMGGSSVLTLRFIGSATAPDPGEPFWQSPRSWTIISASGASSAFSSVEAGVYQAGSFGTAATGAGIVLTFTPGAPPAPAPVITAVENAGSGSVTVTWNNTVTGTNYILLYNTNLNTTNWYVSTNVVATGSTVTVQDAAVAGEEQRYYRVQIQ